MGELLEIIVPKSKNVLTGIPTHKDYFFCEIKTYKYGVDGRVFLFPGCLKAFLGGVNVRRSSGI
jgi:hypothetical protein